MQTEKGQLSSKYSSDRSYPYSARNTFSAICLLILLGAFVAPNALACHRGKAHGPHTCDGDGGSGGPVVGGPTVAGFVGPSGIDDNSARDCEPAGELLTTGGTFGCTTEAVDGVHLSTFAMHLQARKKDVALCGSFGDTRSIDQVSALLPGSYSYGWTDNCAEDGACRIEINMSFSGAQISSATGGASDALNVQISGTLTGSLDGNPFAVARELPISQITMQWFKPGSTAVQAVCDWYPQSVEIGALNSVVFVTEAL